MSSIEGRPETAAGLLEGAAWFLDQLDTLLIRIARMHGMDYESDDTVQRDLRVMGNWLREHPAIDKELRQHVEVSVK